MPSIQSIKNAAPIVLVFTLLFGILIYTRLSDKSSHYDLLAKLENHQITKTQSIVTPTTIASSTPLYTDELTKLRSSDIESKRAMENLLKSEIDASRTRALQLEKEFAEQRKALAEQKLESEKMSEQLMAEHFKLKDTLNSKLIAVELATERANEEAQIILAKAKVDAQMAARKQAAIIMNLSEEITAKEVERAELEANVKAELILAEAKQHAEEAAHKQAEAIIAEAELIKAEAEKYAAAISEKNKQSTTQPLLAIVAKTDPISDPFPQLTSKKLKPKTTNLSSNNSRSVSNVEINISNEPVLASSPEEVATIPKSPKISIRSKPTAPSQANQLTSSTSTYPQEAWRKGSKTIIRAAPTRPTAE